MTTPSQSQNPPKKNASFFVIKSSSFANTLITYFFILTDIGPISSFVGMFLRQIFLQQGIPYEMKLPQNKPLAYGSLDNRYISLRRHKRPAHVNQLHPLTFFTSIYLLNLQNLRNISQGIHNHIRLYVTVLHILQGTLPRKHQNRSHRTSVCHGDICIQPVADDGDLFRFKT